MVERVSPVTFLVELCYSSLTSHRQVPGLRMVSGRKKKKGPVNVPKPTRLPPMERIAAQRAERRALQMPPPMPPPSPARDPGMNQGDDPQARDDDDEHQDLDVVDNRPPRTARRRIVLPETDDEDDEENLQLGREAEVDLGREERGEADELDREEREEEDDLARRHLTVTEEHEPERALVTKRVDLPRKVTLTLKPSTPLVPAQNQV